MLQELLSTEIAPIGSTHLSTFFDERTAQRVQFCGQGIDIRPRSLPPISLILLEGRVSFFQNDR